MMAAAQRHGELIAFNGNHGNYRELISTWGAPLTSGLHHSSPKQLLNCKPRNESPHTGSEFINIIRGLLVG